MSHWEEDKSGEDQKHAAGFKYPIWYGNALGSPANTESSAGEIFDLKRREKTEREGGRERAHRSNKDEHIRGKYLRSISKKSHR